MSSAARSIFAYSIYLFGLGGTLLLAPNVPLPIFGLPPATEVWVRVVGMTVVFFAIYYLVAARNEFRPFFGVSVPVLSEPSAFRTLNAGPEELKPSLFSGLVPRYGVDAHQGTAPTPIVFGAALWPGVEG